MHVHTVIVGAGPGGLACAKKLAEAGLKPLILERKAVIGQKVCAGGITWGGLINRLPGELAERSFPVQHLRTALQSFTIEEKDPIIATVNREQLGRFMADQAIKAGATLCNPCQVLKIEGNSLLYREEDSGQEKEVDFEYLVGADGSTSLVRRHLGLETEECGVGINYLVTGPDDKMVWHLNQHLFANGYAWIFPHKERVSVGVYADRKAMRATDLKKNLITWAATYGFDLKGQQARAELINFDFRGWRFGNTFLVGDAAGLASALTGEGIFPALLSGEETAKSIIDPQYQSVLMDKLAEKHRLHRRLVRLSGQNKIMGFLLAELAGFGLRSGLIKFESLEMAV